mmetsp:Transcript_21388/g.26209  ORF Transcript_21388/g.26209 Transcript_21388/m.26209 type:complete len:161 (-) Transcript_21388:1026-1508(-)
MTQWHFLQLITLIRQPFFQANSFNHFFQSPNRILQHLPRSFINLLLQQKLHNPIIEIGSSQQIIPGTRQNLNIPLTHVQHTHVQRPTPKVVHQNMIHVGFAMQTVRQRRGGGFLQDTGDLDPGAGKGGGGGAALDGGEFGGDRNDGAVDVGVSEMEGGEG